MARPRTVQLQTLFDNLPAGEVVSAADLVDRLGVTRTTLSRLVAEAGADFVAVSAGVWDHPDGPAAAVRAFTEILSQG